MGLSQSAPTSESENGIPFQFAPISYNQREREGETACLCVCVCVCVCVHACVRACMHVYIQLQMTLGGRQDIKIH